MPKITYIEHNGKTHVITGVSGHSLMETAVKNGVSGIDAECGGACACATCHVYVDEAWFGRLPPADSTEQSMLDFAVDPSPTSRLSCQIKLSDELDGLLVRLPVSQH